LLIFLSLSLSLSFQNQAKLGDAAAAAKDGVEENNGNGIKECAGVREISDI
jgi:hypothetical protein